MWGPRAAHPQYREKVCPESTAAKRYQGPYTPTTWDDTYRIQTGHTQSHGRPGRHLPRRNPQLHENTGILGPEKALEDGGTAGSPSFLTELPTTAVHNVQDVEKECLLEKGKHIHSDQAGHLTALGQGRTRMHDRKGNLEQHCSSSHTSDLLLAV